MRKQLFHFVIVLEPPRDDDCYISFAFPGDVGEPFKTQERGGHQTKTKFHTTTDDNEANDNVYDNDKLARKLSIPPIMITILAQTILAQMNLASKTCLEFGGSTVATSPGAALEPHLLAGGRGAVVALRCGVARRLA